MSYRELNMSGKIIRKAKQDDLKLIFDSWQKSFKNSDMTNKMPTQLYNSCIERIIVDLLKNGSEISVLTQGVDTKTNRDIIVAWACHGLKDSTPVLHYVWVKQPFRGQGAATELLASVGIGAINNYFYSARAPLARILERHSKIANNGTYNPYLQQITKQDK